ncbi:hypothetical protein NL676_019618 [Syzygium grande]|nr:hypothetical protein NL676_019618 [Syzygium grande]
MAPARKFIRFSGSSRRTVPPSPPQPRRYKGIAEILATAKHAVVERESYSDVICEQCRSGDRADELLLCDKCDKGFHMNCLRPIVVKLPMGSWLCPKCVEHRRVRKFSQKKIIDFFRIQRSGCVDEKCGSPQSQDTRKRRKRSGPLVMQKKRRRLLPFTPVEDPSQRLREMGSLASALTALKMEFSDDLTYLPGWAPRSANQAKLEKGGMQVLPKEDIETLEHCRAMSKRGEWPPLLVVFDSCEGFTVEADGPIKDMTFIAEYTGDVDYLKNREKDDCDSMMTLLLRGNIARFINGINNHTSDGKKKQNCKCVRYNVNGQCRVFLVATRDIAKGERLYYDYNGLVKVGQRRDFPEVLHFGTVDVQKFWL